MEWTQVGLLRDLLQRDSLMSMRVDPKSKPPTARRRSVPRTATPERGRPEASCTKRAVNNIPTSSTPISLRPEADACANSPSTINSGRGASTLHYARHGDRRQWRQPVPGEVETTGIRRRPHGDRACTETHHLDIRQVPIPGSTRVYCHVFGTAASTHVGDGIHLMHLQVGSVARLGVTSIINRRDQSALELCDDRHNHFVAAPNRPGQPGRLTSVRLAITLPFSYITYWCLNGCRQPEPGIRRSRRPDAPRNRGPTCVRRSYGQ